MKGLKPLRLYLLTFCALLVLPSALFAGGLEKGFEALQKKDYYGAKKTFEKLLSKEPIGASYGLSKVHYERQNPFYDIDLSMRYCNTADSLFDHASMRDVQRLDEMGIKRSEISVFKHSIAERAFEELQKDFTEEGLNDFLSRYRFSKSHPQAVEIRDSLAFIRASAQDDYLAYRDFITDYPGAKQRAAADSLYALRFFEDKTQHGSFDDYMEFVKEFPANPYTEMAYDILFAEVVHRGELLDYLGYINELPENKNSHSAWRAVNLIELRDYNEEKIREVISEYPFNPYLGQLKKELSLYKTSFFVLKANGGEQLIDLSGRTIGTVKQEIFDFQEGLAKVVEGGRIGYMDKAGTMVVPARFTDGFDYNDGVAVVESGGSFGAIDRFGDVIIPFEYDELGNMHKGRIAYEQGDRSGFLDWNGRPILELKFDYVADYKDDYAVVRKDGLYGAIDMQGDFSIPNAYDWVEEYVDGVSRVRRGQEFGLYRHEVGEEIPVEYQALGKEDMGLRLAAKDGKYGFLDSRGEWAIPMDFDFVDRQLDRCEFQGDYAAFYKNGKWGLMDREGRVLIKPIYDELDNTGYSVIAYRKGSKWGHVDVGGHEFSRTYDAVGPFVQGRALVTKGGRSGLIDLNGDLVVPMEYAELSVIRDTDYVVYSYGDGEGLMTRDGSQVLEPSYEQIEAANIRYLRLQVEGVEELYDLNENKVVWSGRL